MSSRSRPGTTFSDNVGFDTAAIVSLLAELRAKYGTLILIGYSVGATLAWLAARSGLCDGAVCHYGSRIRQYCDAAPPCPTQDSPAMNRRSIPAPCKTSWRNILRGLPDVQCAAALRCRQSGVGCAPCAAGGRRHAAVLTLIQQRQEA